MHPGVGPRVEAEQLYVGQSRLVERLAAGPVVLFDVGLGAGSNALAALAAAARCGGRLDVISFERDLGALELALTPEFGLDAEAARAARTLLAHGAYESGPTRWRLRHGDLLAALEIEAERADLVFWDPFSPRANPELWTVEAFAAMRARAGQRCTLFTYSASTATRAAMLLAGWAVGVGASIGGKQETTAAAVRVDDLARPLDARWLARLRRSDAPLPDRAAERVAALPQFRTARVSES
jgi:queuine tRNA-ribosyltransferase